MGNQHPKYETTYYAWQQYRSKIKSSTKSIIPVSPKSHSSGNFNSTTFSSQMKATPIQSSTRQPESLSMRQDQMKNSNPSVVGSSNKAQNGQGIQQSQLKRTSITSSNSQGINTQLQKTKFTAMSSPSISGSQSATNVLFNNEVIKEKKIRFASKIDIIDTFKAEVKSTRNRIDTIANAQQNEYKWILSQIYNEKVNLLPDRNKMVYLLKEAVDYERLIIGLRTKRQVIVRIVNQLNEQKYNQDMRRIVNQTNEYVDSVQKQFIRIDWKTIIMQAPNNLQPYIDIINAGISDPMVQQAFSQVQMQVQAMKPPPPIVQSRVTQQQQTRNISESEINFQKAMQQKIMNSSIKQNQPLINEIQQITISDINKSKQKSSTLSNRFENNINSSGLRDSQNLNSFGLQVFTPSTIQTPRTQVTTSNFKHQSQLNQDHFPQYQPPQKSKLSQINNIKQSSTNKTKPVINAFQSSIKPPPNHNAFSIPQSLLK